MNKFIRKLIDEMPIPFFKRYTIFSGSNSWLEWRAISKDYFSEGSNFFDENIISEYEQAFAKKVGTKYAFGFGAGRMGLYSILEALGIGEEDEVVIPAFTCVVVPNAIIYRGAKPVYVDIDAQTFNIDVADVEKAITPKTRAIYAQHTFGLICDVEGLKKLGKKYNLVVIEDGAHALGASWKGQSVGSLGDVAFFSTDHSKVISTMLGGMVTTNDAGIAERIRLIYERSSFLSERHLKKMCRTFLIEFLLLRSQFYWIGWFFRKIANKMGLFFRFDDELKTEKPNNYPYPARLSTFQAKLGISQLEKLDQNLEHRRSIGGELEKRFNWLGDRDFKNNHTYLRYSFLVADRKRFVKLFRLNYELGIWFTSVTHGRSFEFERIGYRMGRCPIAEKVAKHIVNFPTHENIEIEFLLKKIDKYDHSFWEEMKYNVTSNI